MLVLRYFSFAADMGDEFMRLRKQALGDRNLIGARVELARKNQGMKQKDLLAQLQVSGVDMNASGLSKLEGQIRFVTDFELVALADILDVSVDWWGFLKLWTWQKREQQFNKRNYLFHGDVNR